MLDFKRVALEDKDIIESFLKQEYIMISDVNFTNLFLWRKSRSISFAIVEDCLVIQTIYPSQKPFYFFPIGNGKKIKAIQKLIDFSKKRDEVLEFHSLEQESVRFLEENFANQFDFKLNRDRSDYIYSTAELIALNGRKFHKKKNHLNKFLQTYPNFVFEILNKSNIDEVLNVWRDWFEIQENPSSGLINENIGIIEVLKNWDALNIQGGLIRVDSKIVAFSFGEIVNQDMAVIHIEKADLRFNGAYQIINQQLLENIFSQVQYVNREEDLGIEGLRRAKMSYNPLFLLEKYDAYFIP